MQIVPMNFIGAAFDGRENRVVPVTPGANGSEAMPATTFLVLRDGKAYFEGTPQAMAVTKDPYLKRFLL